MLLVTAQDMQMQLGCVLVLMPVFVCVCVHVCVFADDAGDQ
jgi:hypothetical protein